MAGCGSAWKGVPSEIIIKAFLLLGLGTEFSFVTVEDCLEGERPGGFVGDRSSDGGRQCPKDRVVALQW